MTEYIVFTEPPFSLRVDQISESLKELYDAYGVVTAAYITASNPGSSQLSDDENTRRNRQLLHEIEMLNASYIPSIGNDPENSWPGEPSYLVLDIDRQSAILLGKKYRQNAILWCGRDAVPRLLLLNNQAVGSTHWT